MKPSTLCQRIIPTLFILLFSINFMAQNWVSMMNDTNANFYDIVKEFDNYWKDRSIEKGKGYKAFKRWQWNMEPRVYPSGNMKYASSNYAYEQYQKFLEEQSGNKLMSPAQAAMSATTSNWVPLGPFGNTLNYGYVGQAGRIQCVITKPGDINTIYLGAAAGGFWMSKDGGLTYTTSTDNLGSCGVSDVAIDNLNTNNIYISTGDKDGGDTYATGVLKSTDGGLTWNLTGLNWQPSQQRRIYRLLINPINPNTLIVASSVGVYRSLNAGATWSLVLNGNFVDAEYKPGDTTAVYVVSGGGFYRSTNGGASFNAVSISNTMSSNRLSMAVTSANSNYIYILASATNNGFGGLYRSTNGGNSFTLMSSSPNIFDWSTNGNGSGGQGWYDIAIDASPSNANEIIAGGVSTWKSTNGGSTWALHTHWSGGGFMPLIHADLHCVKYIGANSYFLGTDGGLVKTTNGGINWTNLNGNINIGQIYKLGLSASSASQIVTGHQDNGSQLLTAAGWNNVLGGDGMDCFIDWNNNNVIVASSQNGAFARSTNGGASFVGITNGLSGNAAWVAPIVQDPVSPNTFYCGYQNVYKSTNQGTTWQQLGTIGTTLDEIKVSPSNPNIMYASSTGGLWRSGNGGGGWSGITSGIPTGNAQLTDFAFDNLNPNIIYVTFSGYSSGNKVFFSNNGGATWTNYSAGLPNIPVNCIVYANNSPQALYIGTDIGVYYREASMSNWMPYFNGLPNIIVRDLEIYYPSNKLRAATYARGVWETDLYSNPGAPPVAAYQTLFTPACINTPLQFMDVSANAPSAWNWTFTGGTPSVSILQNPMVTYSASGIYTVQLSSSSPNGSSTPYISTVSVVNNPNVIPINASVCIGQYGVIGVNTNANLVNWSSGQQGFNIPVTNSVTSAYSFTASLGACNSTGASTLYLDPVPVTPTIVLMSGFLGTTVSATTYQWYLNGSIIPGANQPTYVPLQDGYYSVWVGNGNCFASSEPFQIILTELTEWHSFLNGLQIGPNPFQNSLYLNFVEKHKFEIELKMTNTIGQLIHQSTLDTKTKTEFVVNIPDLPAGLYFVTISGNNKESVYKFVKQ